MLRNYLKSAWRHMRQGKLHALISLICLSAGLSGAILIVLFIRHERSYDTHHENHRDIYRIEAVYKVAGGTDHMAITAFPLGPALKEEFSQVREYVRFYMQEHLPVRAGENVFQEEGFAFTDSTIFDVFTHHFVYGRAEGSLSRPNSLVLTRSTSERFFGTDDPMGEMIEVHGQPYMVTAVIEDLPDNSHLRYDGLLSISSIGEGILYSLDPQYFWNINFNYTYLQLHPGHNIDEILGNMEAFHEKYLAPFGRGIAASARFEATPLRLTRFRLMDLTPPSLNASILLIFGVVALFLIIIAAVNYTNLATARAASRAREIGIRKVSGASQKELIIQFMTESTVIALVSLVVSLFLAEMLMPHFNVLTGKQFGLSDLLSPGLLVRALLISLGTGLLAGIYPAIYLSRLDPVSVLHGGMSVKGGSGTLRKALVIFQFTISMMLITGTLMVQRQLSFLQGKDLGFEKENRVMMTVPSAENRQRIELLEHTLEQSPLVLAMAKTSGPPGVMYNKIAIRAEIDGSMTEAVISTNYIDEKYLDLMGISLVSGRNFDSNLEYESAHSVLINESAARYFGWHDDALGKRIAFNHNEEGEPQTSLQVIGVVKDHHFLSLQHPIEPLMLLAPTSANFFGYLAVAHAPGRETEIRALLEESWAAFDPARVSSIHFIDEYYRNQYVSEERLGRIFAYFALLCIIISFAGLFGLASYLCARRRKEIGIRKVLGASSAQVLTLFYREFTLLITISLLISAPLSWWAMSRWLAGFVYQSPMTLTPILIAGGLSLLIALITVSYHSLSAAMSNPALTIRAE